MLKPHENHIEEIECKAPVTKCPPENCIDERESKSSPDVNRNSLSPKITEAFTTNKKTSKTKVLNSQR